jgi:nucleotide-binding universal stress UspA family protein
MGVPDVVARSRRSSGVEVSLKHILAPTDFSEQSQYAKRYALSLAQQHGATVHLMHVIQDVLPVLADADSPVASAMYLTEADHSAREYLRAEAPAELAEKLRFELVVRRGTPFLEIVRYAREANIDMIVMATHGRTGLAHMLMGSVAEKVVRKAACPVLTIRHPEQQFVMP